jgi:hypothetical protein
MDVAVMVLLLVMVLFLVVYFVLLVATAVLFPVSLLWRRKPPIPPARVVSWP